MKDYYRILQVGYDSSEKEIEAAYESACCSFADKKVTSRSLIDEAYAVLSDPKAKKKFDLEIYQFAQFSCPPDEKVDAAVNRLEEGFDYYQKEYDNEQPIISSKAEANTGGWKNRYWVIAASVFGLMVLMVLFFRADSLFQKVNDLDSSDHVLNATVEVDPNVAESKTAEELHNTTQFVIEDKLNSNFNVSNEQETYGRVHYANYDSSMKKDGHNPTILYETNTNYSTSSEIDRKRIDHLLKEPWYRLKDPYPELNHDEKLQMLNNSTEEFFSRTFMGMKEEGKEGTIENAFTDKNGSITYLVLDNTGYAFIFIPALYVSHSNGNMAKIETYYLVLYQIEIINGELYAIHSPLNPFTAFVEEELASTIVVRFFETYWFNFIPLDIARSVHDKLISDQLSLDYIRTAIVEEDLAELSAVSPFKEIEDSDIKELQEEYLSQSYTFELYDPYESMTEIDKLKLLKENPHQFFEDVLLGPTGINQDLEYMNVKPEYYVEDNKGYMYIDIPFSSPISDGYEIHTIDYHLFIMYEIAIESDGIYAKYIPTDPYIQNIKDKAFHEGVTPIDFRFENVLLKKSDSYPDAKQRYLEELLSLQNQLEIRIATIKSYRYE